LALAASLSVIAQPSIAKDIVGFVDQVAEEANPSQVLIIHDKEGFFTNIIDTMTAAMKARNFKYDFQTYNQGDRPRDIARGLNWPTYGAVLCMGQGAECDQIKAQAAAKGFEGDFYDYMLEKR